MVGAAGLAALEIKFPDRDGIVLNPTLYLLVAVLRLMILIAGETEAEAIALIRRVHSEADTRTTSLSERLKVVVDESSALQAEVTELRSVLEAVRSRLELLPALGSLRSHLQNNVLEISKLTKETSRTATDLDGLTTRVAALETDVHGDGDVIKPELSGQRPSLLSLMTFEGPLSKMERLKQLVQ